MLFIDVIFVVSLLVSLLVLMMCGAIAGSVGSVAIALSVVRDVC